MSISSTMPRRSTREYMRTISNLVHVIKDKIITHTMPNTTYIALYMIEEYENMRTISNRVHAIFDKTMAHILLNTTHTASTVIEKYNMLHSNTLHHKISNI